MIELPGLTPEKKTEGRYDFYVPLSVTLNVAIVTLNLLPIYVFCKTRSRAQVRPATDEIVLIMSVSSIFFVLLPSAFQLIAFYNRSRHEKQTICHLYQVSVGCLYLANMWLATYACYARLHAASVPHAKLDLVLPSTGLGDAAVRLRIAVSGIFVCAFAAGSVPLLVLVGGEPIYDQRCRFWLFETPRGPGNSPAGGDCVVLFVVFAVIQAGSVLLAVGGIVVAAVSTWSARGQPRFKQIEAPAAVRGTAAARGQSDEGNAVVEWGRIAVSVSGVLVITWSIGLAVVILLRLDIVSSAAVAKCALCSSTLSNLANPLIYNLMSSRYRRHYRQIFTATSRFLFGCPMTRHDVDDTGSHVAINCNGVCGENDLLEARTCRSVDRSCVSFSARTPSSTAARSKKSTVANIDTTALDGCGGRADSAAAAPGSLPGGTLSRPPGHHHHYPVPVDLDPTRGHSSVNPCDYDDSIDMKVRTIYGAEDGDWIKESAEYESGVSLLTDDGSDDGSVSEETEVENVDYPL